MEILPRVQSQLLRIAVNDLKKLSDQKDVEINMLSWVSIKNGSCSVCMAGAVMLCRDLLPVVVDGLMSDCDYGPGVCGDNKDQLCAINNMREGSFIYTFEFLTKKAPTIKQKLQLFRAGSMVIADFSDDKLMAPLETYERVAAFLEKHGL